MSSPQQPNSAIPKPLPDDDDDVSWALQTAAVQWQRGAYQDALVWLRRAAESAIELSKWSRAADLNAIASRLEKQLGKGGTGAAAPVSQAPSAPPRNAMLPSFPVSPATAQPASPRALGQLPATSRTSTGLSSLPPLPSIGPSSPPSGRSSVVIDVEESELELSDDEIRELESENATSDIPNGARPSTSFALRPSERPSDLPSFELESSRPIPSRPAPRRDSRSQKGDLPSFALEPSAPPPAARGSSGFGASEAATRSAGRPGATSLPSFPLETTASSLPPVSKWPRLGSPGTSHLPPSPALPSFESAAPSRSFADDGDDGAEGIDDVGEQEPILEEPLLEAELLEEDSSETPVLEQLEPFSVETAQPSNPPADLDLMEIEGPRQLGSNPKRTASGLGPVSVRPSRSAPWTRSSSPLPPALPEGRPPSARPLVVRAGDHSGTPPPPIPPPAPSTPAQPGSMPRLTPTNSLEPRMPKRTLSYASPLDFGSRPPSHQPTVASSAPPPTSNRITSSAPTVRKMEIAEPVSVPPPPSARSIEPEDLPTVSSPSLSAPPPAYTTAPPPAEGGVAAFGEERGAAVSHGFEARPTESRSSDPAFAPSRRSPSPEPERRKFTYRFEEPKQSDLLRSDPPRSEPPRSEPPHDELARADGIHDTDRAAAGAAEAPVVEPIVAPGDEPLAVLPPVTMRPSAEPSSASTDDVYLSGVRLADVRGFADLPASAHRLLAQKARIEALAAGEEASFFSVALVLEGWVGLMPAIADCACATAVVGEVVFTEGTLSDGLMLRVVAGQDDVVVATWDSDAIVEATKECPWVADDLRLLADGFQALAGACLGPLGDRLDDSLRSIVTSRCEIRTLLPGEQLCAARKPVPGMHIIGGGTIELVDENSRVAKTHGTGEFLFAPQVLAGGVAPYSARAGSKGALVLFAPRMAAHELLVSVPPLLEILAD